MDRKYTANMFRINRLSPAGGWAFGWGEVSQKWPGQGVSELNWAEIGPIKGKGMARGSSSRQGSTSGPVAFHRQPVADRPRQRHLIGILQFPAKGDSAGNRG